MSVKNDTVGYKIGRAIGGYVQQLTVILVVLKLFGLIDWSWVAVFAPDGGLLLLCLVALGIITLIDRPSQP